MIRSSAGSTGRPVSRRLVLGGLTATAATLALPPSAGAATNPGGATTLDGATNPGASTNPGTATNPGAATDPDGGRFRCDLPAPTGPHPVGTVDLHLVDPRRSDPWAEDGSRPRELMITVWYPARRDAEAPATPYATPGLGPAFDTFAGSLGIPAGSVDWTGIGTHTTVGAPVAQAARRLPVVLYTPGRLNPRFLDTTVTAELASHGYAVVAVDHTYESLAVEFPGGRVITPAPALAGELSPQVMKAAVG